MTQCIPGKGVSNFSFYFEQDFIAFHVFKKERFKIGCFEF